MPDTIEPSPYMQVHYRLSDKEVGNQVSKDLKSFRIRIWSIISITVAMCAGLFFYPQFADIITFCGGVVIFLILFEVACYADNRRYSEYMQCLIEGAVWLLWKSEVVVHKVTGDEYNGVDTLPRHMYIKLNRTMHLVPDRKTALALKLSIP